MAVLQGDDESLAPRARALARLAVTLTAQPWALTQEPAAEARCQGLDEGQFEAAIAVIAMFNYYTRVADASGIEFDYATPLPAFEPDLSQAAVPRPHRPAGFGRGPDQGQDRPRGQGLRAAWESWRFYVMEAEKPVSQRERQLLATVAAEESTDWECVDTLGGLGSLADGDEHPIELARKLSRQSWTMQASGLAKLRAAGYPDEALLHIISVVAHQNADSRLTLGLRARR